jgi:hypothetical protein
MTPTINISRLDNGLPRSDFSEKMRPSIWLTARYYTTNDSEEKRQEYISCYRAHTTLQTKRRISQI